MSIIRLFLISLLISATLNDTAPTFVSELTCGESSPKKAEDCTKYGTGSGMLCCWIASDKESKNGECYLLPETKADEYGIDGDKLFDSSSNNKYNYWSCGNKSTILHANLILLLLALFSL